MKKFATRVLALVFCLALVFSGCTGDAKPAASAAKKEAAPDKVYVMRIGNVTAPDHILNVSFEEMAKAINERSGGRIEATVFPSGQLGTLRTMTEGLQNGTLEMATQSPGGVASFWPVMGVLELPYMYKSHQDVYKVVDGEIGQELNAKFLEKTGVRILSYWMNFYRHTTNNVRPIATPADFKGLKLRVPETKTLMDGMLALGANASPMAVGELYTALSQGTMDGQENPASVIYASKYYEVQKYLSLTGHVYSPIIITVSDDFYQSLPDDLRTIVDEEVEKEKVRCRAASEKIDDEMVEKLKKEGMLVNEVDTAGFREIVQPAYDSIIADAGEEAKDYIARIEKAIA